MNSPAEEDAADPRLLHIGFVVAEAYAKAPASFFASRVARAHARASQSGPGPQKTSFALIFEAPTQFLPIFEPTSDVPANGGSTSTKLAPSTPKALAPCGGSGSEADWTASPTRQCRRRKVSPSSRGLAFKVASP